MALSFLERALDICQDMAPGVHRPANFLRIAADLGAAYTLAGRVDDAIPLLTQVVEAQSTATEGESSGMMHCRLSLGEAQMLAGHLEEAHARAEHELTLAHTHQRQGLRAYALRLLGEIAAARKPLERDKAEAYYLQALALADELGMRPLQAHCHAGLGTLYTTTGQREQARAALSVAIALYRVMEMTFWLTQTEVTLAQVVHATGSPGGQSLTVR
jgi:tetratricopeptide (TPR) repeat protein